MAKRANTKSEASLAAALDRYFGLAQQGTDVRTEFIAGVTTFLTMVYIIFVNPIILGKAGMDQGAVFVATCVAAAVSTMVMALYANYPIALAPGMGINAFFAFTVVLTYKYTWQQALAAVFCSGVLFCASSRMMNESFSVRPRMKARGITSMTSLTMNRFTCSKSIMSCRASNSGRR